jgi:hypothetical protein
MLTYTIDGETRTLAEWSAILGVASGTLHWRWFRSKRAKDVRDHKRRVKRVYEQKKRDGDCVTYGCGSPAVAPSPRCDDCRRKLNERTRLAKQKRRAMDVLVLGMG